MCGKGHSNILQQNTIVSLADKTPTELAGMVMAASGGAVFDSMVETVHSNIAKAEQEKLLTETKIAQFQRDVGSDGKRIQLVDDCDKMAAELSMKQQLLSLAELTVLFQEEIATEQQIRDLTLQREGVQHSLQVYECDTHTRAQENRHSDLKEAERLHAEHLKQLRVNQELQAEEAEEESILEAQLAEDQAEHEETKRTLDSLIASRKLIAARQLEVYDEVARNDAELQRLTELLRAPEDGRDSAARIEVLRSSLVAQNAEHSDCTSRRKRIQKLLDERAVELARCDASHAEHKRTVEQLRTTMRTGIQLSEQELLRNLSVVDIALETVQHQLQVTTAARRPQDRSQKNRPLPLVKQLCFGDDAEKYLDALGEIAGSKLQTFVVRDVDAGAELLRKQRSTGTVVWPLDRLKPNMSAAEEAFVATAVQECQGEATLPSSILSFTGPLASMSEVPFKRVFGGWAISTTPRATKWLLQKRVRTCELNGTKHVPGTVSGGFFGGSQRRNAVRAEFEDQKQQVASQALEGRAAALAAERAELVLRLQAATDLSNALEKQRALQSQQVVCAAEMATHEAEIGDAERSERLVRQQIEMTSTELNNRLTQDEAAVQSGLQGAQANLMQQNQNLAAELSSLDSDLQQAGADEIQLTDRLRMMEAEDDAADSGEKEGSQSKLTKAQLKLQCDVAHHRQKRAALQEAEKSLLSTADRSATICTELQAMIEQERAKSADADQQQHGLQQQLQDIGSKLQSEEDRLKTIATKQSKLITSERAPDTLRRDARAQAQESSSGAHDAVDMAELRVELKVLEQTHTALQKALSESSENIGPDVDVSALAAKQNQLSEFLQKRETIDNAIRKLREEIAASEHKKNTANQKAFDAISATFAEYFATLAPSKEAQLRIGSPDSSASHRKRGGDADKQLSDLDRSDSSNTAAAIDQVHFVVRTRRSAVSSNSVHSSAISPMECGGSEESGGGSDQPCAPVAWKTSTNELSGGQRTLLGLAFVLSIAKYQPSPVYILDEVDAALDEGNQARVATLVSQARAPLNKSGFVLPLIL